MFYRRDQPGIPAITVLLALLWLLLAGYIITHPDPIGIIILVVMGVFIAGPAIFVLLGTRRARQTQPDQALLADESHDTHDGMSHGQQNGHYIPGANGAPREPNRIDQQGQQEQTGEIPEEGGNTP